MRIFVYVLGLISMISGVSFAYFGVPIFSEDTLANEVG